MTKHDDRPCTCREGPVWNCPRHAREGYDGRLRNTKKGVPRASVAQQVRTAFLNGIKAERARLMYENFGWVFCERCNVAARGMNFDDAIKWATSTLDAAHVVKRSRGTRYLGPLRMGIDNPTNIALLCRKCHNETEGDVTDK